MRFTLILLMLFPLLAGARTTLLKSHTLFNFGNAPNGWRSELRGKKNLAVFKYDDRRGAHLILPKAPSDPAPNVYYQWDSPQDWSEYNFMQVEIYNPSQETDRLEIDLSTDNGKSRVSHHPVYIPPQKEFQLLIPLSAYQNWTASPANLRKVRRLSLIRRSPPRELHFYIRNIKLLKLAPTARKYRFDGLTAYQFGATGQTSKNGFELISPDSPFWSGAPRSIDVTPNKQGRDELWNSMMTGDGVTELSLPVKPGKYLVFTLFHGKPLFKRDTVIGLGSREYRHIICNAYPEYRLMPAEVENDTLIIRFRPGETGSHWGITALIVMEAEQTDKLLREFAWPAFDDMAVAPWDLRSFMAENREKTPSVLQFAEWDIYTGQARETGTLNREYFSIISPVDIAECTIKCPPGTTLRRAIPYASREFNGYIRQPRFFATVNETFSMRGGMREYFKLEAIENISGVLSITTEGSVLEIPLELSAAPPLKPSAEINYFLYYYAMGFGGSPESVRHQLRQEQQEFEFLARNGFSSIEIPMMAAVKFADGQYTFDFSAMNTFIAKYRRYWPDAGGTMPVFLFPQMRAINRTIGKADYLWNMAEYEKSIPVIQEFVRQSEVAARANNWPQLAYYPFDEFGNPEYTAKLHRAIKEAGGLTYSTSVGRYGNGFEISAGDGLDIYCYPNLKDANLPAMRQQATKINAQIWRYDIENSAGPLYERYSWGLCAWALKLRGQGAWHFDGRNFSISELQDGSYYYAYAAYGGGEVMPTLSIFAVNDAMLDYAALISAEKSGKAQQLLDELRQDAARLGPTPGERALQQWFNTGGRGKLEKIWALR